MSDAAEWARLYVEEGLSFAQVGARVGRPWNTVRWNIIALGVKPRPVGRRPRSMIARSDWGRRYLAGATTITLAAEAGMTPAAICRELRKQGVTLRRRGTPGGSRTPWHQEAVRLRAEGLTNPQIAERFDVTSQAVSQAIRRVQG